MFSKIFKHNRNRVAQAPLSEKVLIILSFLFFAGIVLVPACMETTTPADTNTHKLSVRVYQIDPAKPGTMISLRGAQVNVNESGKTDILSGTTNDQGLAVFPLNIQLTGTNYDVRATFNNKTQVKNSILLCQDSLVVFLFDTTVVKTIDCGNLNGSDTLVFINDEGSTKLKQNTPIGINKYIQCWNITNSLSNPNDITVNIPAVTAPFGIESINVGITPYPITVKQVQIPPGSTLTICFNVSTENAGTFKADVNFPLACGATQGTYKLHLEAEVVAPTCSCEELTGIKVITLSDRVQVGKSAEQSVTVLTNTLSCTIEVSQASFDNNNSWEILSPAFPVNLNKGDVLNLNVRFTPKTAKESNGILILVIKPQGTTQVCSTEVHLQANGCNTSCPLLSKDRQDYQVFSPRMIIDTLSDRVDNRVFVSTQDISVSSGNSQASRTYYILNPDSACSDITVTITPTYADDYAKKYYNISPKELNLAPGEFGSIDITFTAPTLAELQQITTARGNTGRLTDSLFKVTIQISSPSCTQKIEDNAVVTKYPEISPIINLRAYAQRTRLKSEPENEVYTFGNGSRTIVKGPGGVPGPYPPNLGDIFIDVNDTSAAANPPQPPILKLVDNSIGMKVWKTGYTESDFSNVQKLYNDFLADPAYSTGYSTTPISNLNVGDVIAFQISANVYALIYIRRIDNGTENTSSKQSGIEFRSVYPIYIP